MPFAAPLGGFSRTSVLSPRTLQASSRHPTSEARSSREKNNAKKTRLAASFHFECGSPCQSTTQPLHISTESSLGPASYYSPHPCPPGRNTRCTRRYANNSRMQMCVDPVPVSCTNPRFQGWHLSQGPQLAEPYGLECSDRYASRAKSVSINSFLH